MFAKVLRNSSIHPSIFRFSGSSDMRLKYLVDIQGEISEHRIGTLFDFTKKLQDNNMFLISKFSLTYRMFSCL